MGRLAIMVKWSEARYALLSWTLSEFQFVDLRGSLTRAVAHCLEYGRLQDALPEQPQVNRLVQLVLEDCSTLPHELHFLQLGDEGWSSLQERAALAYLLAAVLAVRLGAS